MKKLLFVLSLFIGLSGMAQTSFTGGGTVTDTGSDTLSVQQNGYYAVHGIQYTVTKVSGTVAGVARLYASADGTNFVATGDTLTLTNVATQSVIWTKTTPVYQKYRIITTGSGTMVANTGAKLTARKP